jgi:hypothetical protein
MLLAMNRSRSGLIDRPIFRRNRIDTRLRTPGGVFGLAGQKSLVKRLLDRIEHPRPGLRQVPSEIAEERSLSESSFVAVETMLAESGGVGSHYEPSASPFNWTFTRRDLHVLLAKIAAKQLAPAA